MPAKQMCIKHGVRFSYLLLCALFPVTGICAESIASAEMPSMDFLEYLGAVENEVDGELSGPIELDLEPAIEDKGDE